MAAANNAAAAAVERCRGCRRPEGETVEAWRTGHWAREREGRWAFFNPAGVAISDRAALDKIFDGEGSRTVKVELDRRGYCLRCAHQRLTRRTP